MNRDRVFIKIKINVDLSTKIKSVKTCFPFHKGGTMQFCIVPANYCQNDRNLSDLKELIKDGDKSPN